MLRKHYLYLRKYCLFLIIIYFALVRKINCVLNSAFICRTDSLVQSIEAVGKQMAAMHKSQGELLLEKIVFMYLNRYDIMFCIAQKYHCHYKESIGIQK